MKKDGVKVILVLIILIAAALRLYKLDQIPPSISWDEAAVGYNAYTIANWGKDEWGRSFPLVFESFEDDKHPVHIYFTAVSVKLLGLSEFSTRLPSAIFGVANVVIIFYLGKIFFSSTLAGLIAAIFLAISPYAVHFSRFNHEANFALFFFMAGLLMFFRGIKEKPVYLPLSFLSFGISLLSYHSPKVVVPPLILLLVAFYFREFLQRRKYVLMAGVVVALIGLLMILNPALLGGARAKQAALARDKIIKTALYQRTGNELLARVEVVYDQYLLHLTPSYLFLSGSPNAKFNLQTMGYFYKIDALFLLIGLGGLWWGVFFHQAQRKRYLVLLMWALLAPLPASLVGEAPHPARALFMMGSWHLISAYAFYLIINLAKSWVIRYAVLAMGLLILGWLFKDYLGNYYFGYGTKHAIDWQYGMKQIVEYVKDRNGYSRVYTTDARSQPYIFFLYYLKTPLSEFLRTVVYNPDLEKKKYNLVTSFGKYHFGDWDPIDSPLTPGVLYAVTPSQYGGLRNRIVFDVKKLILYPDGGDAFFLVSYP